MPGGDRSPGRRGGGTSALNVGTESRDARVQRVVLVTFALNLAVALSKIAYGYGAHALAIRADGFHSLTDAANNIVALFALRFATRPADGDHHYGHRKLEVLASTVVGLSLLAMAVDVARSGVTRLLGTGTLPRVTAGAFVVLGLTLVVNLFVASYERSQGEKLQSPFLISDSSHTRSDALVTASVIVAMALVSLGYSVVDVVAALGVAVFIGLAGISVLRQNLAYLTDAAPVAAAAVERVVLAVGGVVSAHKIRTRGFPGSVHVDLHIQIAPHLDVVEAHRITHRTIDAIKASGLGISDVVIHTEPAAPSAEE